GLRWEMAHPTVKLIDLPSPQVGEGGSRSEPDEGAHCQLDAESLTPRPHPGPLPSREREQAAAAGLTGLLPLYPLTEGLQQHHVRRLVRQALDVAIDSLEEVFPTPYLEKHELWTLRAALLELHFPSTRESLDKARRRFVYQELLVLQLALALKRRQVVDTWQAMPLELTAKIDARIRRLCPFSF